jgi:hypothetical protein
MRSQGQALKDKITDSISEIDRLMSITHTEDQYSNLIKNLGGEIEKFLKSSVFQTPNTTKGINDLINDLSYQGVQHQSLTFLHDFRLKYNKYKHDPTYTSDIFECKSVLSNASIAIEEVIALNLGTTNRPYTQTSKRIVWIAGWDDHLGGMTEISIFIPENIDFPTSIEHFNIDWSRWNQVVQKFSATGELIMGEEYVWGPAYKIWKAAPDFLGAGRFTGDFSELIRELSKHINVSKESKLIPVLKRKHDTASVKAAIVFSAFEILTENLWASKDQFVEGVKKKCSYDFGIDSDAEILQKMIDLLDMNEILSRRIELANCQEIIWTDEKGFISSSTKILLSKSLYLKIDLKGTLVVRIR